MLIVYSNKRKSFEIINKLGSIKSETFTKVFGNNNNKKSRDKFFKEDLTKNLWEYVCDKLTYERCFKKAK